MEFALEKLVKATTNKLRIAEVPTTLSPDGKRPSASSEKLARRLAQPSFLSLLFSPRWLFLYLDRLQFRLSAGSEIS
jgi:hypothetical protein